MNNEEIDKAIEQAIAIDTSKDEVVSNEPKRTIFEGISNFNFYKDINKVLRFNSYFKKLGFERVNLNREFGIHTFYPQLTLMINPTLVLTHDNEYEEDEQMTLWNVQRREPTFDLWDKYFYGKKGYLGLRQHNIIKRSGKEEVKPLKIEFQGKELMLGQYLKDRNIVMLHINPFNTDITTEDNEYLELVLKLFEDKMKEIELVKVDVTEKMKTAFIDKFKLEINKKMNEAKSNLRYNENEIDNLQINLLRTIRNAQLNRKQIEGLIAFSTNTDGVILKEIEEVKKLRFVKNIRLTSGGIGLDVGRIDIIHKDERVYIGDFYLIISPDGIKVYCKNPIISRDGQEVSHPHIDGNHNCYGGEREQKIIEFLSTFELQKLVIYVHMFLTTYTANDSYNNLSMWVRDDLKRSDTREIESNEDVSVADFQGDYFVERVDNGNREDYFDDDNDDENDDEEQEDDYMGDCDECGNSIYEHDEYWVRGNNNHNRMFCCEDCRNTWEGNHESDSERESN